MTDTITRDEFDRRVHFGYAGPVSNLAESDLSHWGEQYPDWKGKYWTYTPADPGSTGPLRLEPVNLAPRPKAQR
ncbi:hypothetical protein [Nocardia brasiliensis]|uniref:hypothetical protein n=1 Tax=Nocardia brasiliensis TaxID=37326 RepID=UPI0024565ED9|nr:hypothetical protein [Nocardia brasiliensis]